VGFVLIVVTKYDRDLYESENFTSMDTSLKCSIKVSRCMNRKPLLTINFLIVHNLIYHNYVAFVLLFARSTVCPLYAI
jgi:hypothetical protein